MKKNKGVTLISLVITVIILFILSSISIQVSTGVYNVIKVQNYIAKMKVIQSGVDNFVQEYSENVDTVLASKGFSKLEADDENFQDFIEDNEIDVEYLNIDTTDSWNNEIDSNPENYYYFSAKNLEECFGLKAQNLDVIINFKTRNVISIKGVKQGDNTYYRQYDLKGGDQLK